MECAVDEAPAHTVSRVDVYAAFVFSQVDGVGRCAAANFGDVRRGQGMLVGLGGFDARRRCGETGIGSARAGGQAVREGRKVPELYIVEGHLPVAVRPGLQGEAGAAPAQVCIVYGVQHAVIGD